MSAVLARLTARRPWIVLGAWLLLAGIFLVMALTGFGSRPLFDRLTAGAPLISGSQTEQAHDIRQEHATNSDTIVALFHSADIAAEQDEIATQLAVLHSNLNSVGSVASVVSPIIFEGAFTSPEARGLIAADQHGFAVLINLESDASATAQREAHADVTVLLERSAAALDAGVDVTSTHLIVDAVTGQMKDDLIFGELIALPISMIIMVVVFGGLLAAGMPLLGAGAAISISLGGLWLLSHPMSLDSVVVNVATIVGLGLSIDYGLLMVSRFREELWATQEGSSSSRRSQRQEVEGALERTIASSGRTVTFSALTIALSISGLLALRPDILRSLAAGGVMVVFLAWLSALTLIPACLSLANRKLMQPSPVTRIPILGRMTRILGDVAPENGWFKKLGLWVTRHAWLVTAVVAAFLVVAAMPLQNLQLRSSTVELLPGTNAQAQVWQTIDEQYPALASPPVSVLTQESELSQVQESLADISAVEVIGTGGELGGGYVEIDLATPGIDPMGTEAQTVVRELRSALGDEALVYGPAASQVDFEDALISGGPIAIGIIVLATFVLLFLMTGSLLIPLKALIINLASLAASLGITSWVFGEGHGESLFGFTALGGLESYSIAVVVAFGFGLAMDYEVFLLARIKERYDLHGDNDLAVVEGLQRTGRIITSAALVMMVVFSGLILGEIIAVKQVGFALALTVLVDATLVRMLLVPSTMKLLGDWNWWAPKSLTRVYQRHGIRH